MLLSAVLIEVLPFEEWWKPAAAAEEQQEPMESGATESTPLMTVSRNHSE